MDFSEKDIKYFVEELFKLSGYNFFDYSYKSLSRRLEKILSNYQLSLNELIAKMNQNPLIIEDVVKEITVNTTEFFRDPIVWIEFEEKIIPELKQREKIKIWHPGCSYGHEAFSMLILLNEHKLLEKTTIIGTDLNADVLQSAKNGHFRYYVDLEYLKNFDAVLNRNNDKNVPYSKYFEINSTKSLFQLKPDFLGMVQFYKHDLVTDPYPIEEFDVIMCRNLLIYFNMELQNKVIYNFYNSLKINSYLILGYYESLLGSISNFFYKKGYTYVKIK